MLIQINALTVNLGDVYERDEGVFFNTFKRQSKEIEKCMNRKTHALQAWVFL
jgi:hypothetical protein